MHIDSVLFLTAANEPLAHPISIPSEAIEQIPLGYELHQNYPNPFNPSTTIEFDLPEAAFVSLKVYDMLGREVATLLDDQALEEGRQEVLFTASDFASGVYYYRLKVDRGAFQKINKMVLL